MTLIAAIRRNASKLLCRSTKSPTRNRRTACGAAPRCQPRRIAARRAALVDVVVADDALAAPIALFDTARV
jgi:hypothetical protein